MTLTEANNTVKAANSVDDLMLAIEAGELDGTALLALDVTIQKRKEVNSKEANKC